MASAREHSIDLYTKGESLSGRAFRAISERLQEDNADELRGRLTEEFLARELAMSRTPVREALKRLEATGIVRSTARGYVRVSPTPRDVAAEYEVRALLEPRVAALAAASPISRPPSSVGRGLDFHLAVVRSVGNAVLSRSLEDVLGRSVATRLRLATSAAEASALVEGHEAVADAIAAREADAAAAAMSSHLRVAHDLALAAVARRKGRHVA